MYKTLSRNMQARRDGGLTDFPGARKTISNKEARRREREAMAARLEQDRRRFLDPDNRSRLGGWPIERFDALGASFQMTCPCGHKSPVEKSSPFSRRWAAATDAVQLIKLKHAARCPGCARKGGLTVRIILGRDVVEFGPARSPAGGAPAASGAGRPAASRPAGSRNPRIV